MSANDFDEDLKSKFVYDTGGKLIKEEETKEFDVIDDDYRPVENRVWKRLSGDENVALINLSHQLPPHYVRRLRAYMMRGKTLDEANYLVKSNY